jgi:hypothetical protein
MRAVSSTGTELFELDDTDFVSTASHVRAITISATDTAGYAAGAYKYEVEVTLPDSTVEAWLTGNITVNSELVV